MAVNMGKLDRGFRLVVAAALFILAAGTTVGDGTWVEWAFYGFGAVALLTALEPGPALVAGPLCALMPVGLATAGLVSPALAGAHDLMTRLLVWYSVFSALTTKSSPRRL